MNEYYRSNEQQSFANIIETHMRLNEATKGPLLIEGGAGIGKTRGYLIPAFKAAAGGMKIAIIIPTWELIEQFIASADLQAARQVANINLGVFRPSSQFDTNEKYQQHRENAMQADILICTSASLMIDNLLRGAYSNAKNRDYIIFDEADQLPNIAALQRNKTIAAEDLATFGGKVGSALEMLVQIAASEDPSEARNVARHILKQQKFKEKYTAETGKEAWFINIGFDNEGDLLLFHNNPGRILASIIRKGNVALVSATLSIGGSFEPYKREMGISDTSILSTIIEPIRHGLIRFHVADKVTHDSETWPQVMSSVLKICNKPTLIVTPSYALADTIKQICDGLGLQATNRRPGERAHEATSRMVQEGCNILIAPAAWAGLDTPVRWHSIIVPKIPFEAPVIIDDEHVKPYSASRNAAVRRMRQVLGRGTRDINAECDIYILDARIKYDGIPSFVPSRFVKAFENATIIDGETFSTFVDAAE